MKEEYTKSIYRNDRTDKDGNLIESWRLHFRYKNKQNNNEPSKFTLRFDTEKKAEKFYKLLVEDYLKQFVEAYENQTGYFKSPKEEPEPEPEKPLTFRQYAESYAKWKKKDVKSEKTFLYEIKTLIEYFADTPLSQIDYAIITQFERKMKEPYAKEIKLRATELTRNPKTNRMRYEIEKQQIQKTRSDSTVNLLIKRLRNLLYTAKREKKIDEKPDFHKIVKPENNEETTAITFAEFEQLLAVCTGKRSHLYLQVLCVFEAGCRISEYKAIRKKDLNINSKFCRVNISKQKKNAKYRKPRHCYFSKRLIDAITADGFESKAVNDFLFDGGDYKRAWKTAKRLAFGDTKDAERREKLLSLSLQRSLRKSAGVHYDESRILEFVKDYQLSHAPNTTGGKHYREVPEKLQFEEFQRYEEFSRRERAKLIVKTETPITPTNWDFSFLDKQSTAIPTSA